MDLGKQNILFFSRTMMLGGTENVVLQLCEVFKPKVNKIVVCSCGGLNVEKLKEMGIRHYQISDISEKKDIFKICKTVKQIVKKERITVIHSHHRMAAFYTEILFGDSIIKIANAHNTFFDKKWLTRFAYRNTKVIAVGEMVKKNLVDYFNIPEEQVSVIHNAVKPFEEKYSEDKYIRKLHDDGNFVVGNIGRLSEQKGMEYFIESIPQILKKYSKTRFVIAGVGEDEQKLLNLVKKLGIEEYVKFLGYRKDVQNLMSQLDLIVLSSLWEGLPLTPIEAFSVGKTIVATKVDGTPEIVIDGVDGYLVEPKNSEQIADAVCKVIKNDDKRKQMEMNAKEHYVQKFSFIQLSEKYSQFYEVL